MAGDYAEDIMLEEPTRECSDFRKYSELVAAYAYNDDYVDDGVLYLCAEEPQDTTYIHSGDYACDVAMCLYAILLIGILMIL